MHVVECTMYIVHVSFSSMQLQDMKRVYILEESLLVVMLKFYCLSCHLNNPKCKSGSHISLIINLL